MTACAYHRHVTAAWTFAIDRGGTFTDVVATAPDGTRHIEKLLVEKEA